MAFFIGDHGVPSSEFWLNSKVWRTSPNTPLEVRLLAVLRGLVRTRRQTCGPVSTLFVLIMVVGVMPPPHPPTAESLACVAGSLYYVDGPQKGGGGYSQ